MYTKSVEQMLEELLEKAFEQVAFRPQFLQRLLDSYIYILGTQAGHVGECFDHTLKEGSEVKLKTWHRDDGSEIFPFFTSLEKLQNAIQHEENYLRINTRSFFELTFGSHLVLNPNSQVAKEFTPQEIAGLLNGDYFLHANVEEIQAKSEQSNTQPEEPQPELDVHYAHPSPYPINMVEQIKILLQVNKAVASAFLVQVLDEQRNLKPILIIGLLLSQVIPEHELQQLSRQVSQTAQDSLLQKKSVELVFIDARAREGLSHYFLHETQAFYIRQDEKKKGFFAKLFD